MNSDRLCPTCSVSMVSAHASAVYCSRPCRDRASYLRHKCAIAERLKERRWAGRAMQCLTCGSDMGAVKADKRYCSKRCIEIAQPPCSIHGCDNPRRARGLCSTHYNRRNPAIVIAECAVCGAEVVKAKQQTSRGSVVCSYVCRAFLQFGSWPTCAVPAGHVSRVMSCPVPPDHPSRNPLRIIACDWCATEFIARRWRDRYCSEHCNMKSAKVRRRARESDGHVYSWTQVMQVYALLDNHCAYCGGQPDGLPEPDHVVPLSRGGSNGGNNILPACKQCNSDKRDLLLHEWATDREQRGKPPVRTVLDRTHPAFAHLLPDAIASGRPPIAHAA